MMQPVGVVEMEAQPSVDLDELSNPTSLSQGTESTGKGGEGKAAAAPGGLFRGGGTLPTALCLSKAAIGAGVLSMSAHSAEVGLVYQTVCLGVGAALTLVSVRMVARASIETGRWSYEDICEELFHPAMSMMTGFVNVCNCIGCGAGYLIVCGQVFQVLSGASQSGRNLFVLLVGLFVCGPLALARHVSFMRHLAAFSIAALLFLVVTVVWFLAEHGVDETITVDTLWLGPGTCTIFGYMNNINNVVFAYTNQFNVPQLTGELTPQPGVSRMSNVAALTVVLCVLLFGTVSIFGMLAFGVGEAQGDSLVVDLLPERDSPMVWLALAGVLFSVLTCFQFHIYPIRQFSEFTVRKLRGRAVDEPDTTHFGRTTARWWDIATALGSVLVIIFIALVVTSLKVVLDFIGAFASAWISFVVPPLWILQLLRTREGFSWFSVQPLGCLALFALGVSFFVFGTYSAIAGFLAE